MDFTGKIMETEIPLKCHFSTILPCSGIFPLTGISLEL